ncbi:transcriptional regulator [Jannaschia pagri]|uniref:Transcriptional regulator n=1 Tax=Jannaschia pagri TaxID=2829797 RepID=A0ABQ4NIF0_9RHOB|nr:MULTISPECIES: sigma 54-interacting transcriptional regulator [unclassified Jannaschia]GIT89698.1 transcriptional regulator [Jannaschia sp. AI_61]GIT94194.1 transcriptional regulator [Jannaschia sp. AI_62]
MEKADPFADSVVAALPEAALVFCARSDQIIALNTAARQLLGLPEHVPPFSTLLGESIGRFVVFLDELDSRGSAWTRQVQILRRGQAHLRAELRGRTLPGESGHVVLTLTDLDEMDRRTELTEVAELQRAGLNEWKRAESFFADLERRNQLILNAAGEGIYGLNSEGKTTFVNRAAQEMLGWTAEDLLGKDIHSIMHHTHMNGDVYHHHDCPIYKSFRFEQVNRIEDEVFWRKDGRPMQVEYISTPIYDHQILAGAVVIFRDVTERKENENKLRHALEEIAQLRDRLEQENAYLQEEINSERAHLTIIGTSNTIRQIVARIDLVAPTDATVMISGEPGTGKTLIANEIHRASSRSRRPLIHFNCSSVVPEAVEAELFGQVKGGPHAAKQDKPGKLELAHGGTLFLDDVEDLPPEVQGKLLHALQTNTVRRVGDTREKELDIRVICASTITPKGALAAQRLREALYMHLSLFPITTEPLRDHPEDIPSLATHLLRVACLKLNRPVPSISSRVMQELQAYAWPGNVRELRNVIERAAIVSKGRKLEVEISRAAGASASLPETIRTEAEVQAMVRANIVAALRSANGKVSGAAGAAAILDMKPTTLHSRIKSFDITESDWR